MYKQFVSILATDMKLLCWAEWLKRRRDSYSAKAPAQIPTQNLTYYTKRETTKRRKNKKGIGPKKKDGFEKSCIENKHKNRFT